MYNFKTGEVYRCVSSTNEDRFVVGNLYPVIDVVTDTHDRYIISENGVSYTDTYFNEYMNNGNSNLAQYEPYISSENGVSYTDTYFYDYFHNKPTSKPKYEFKLVELEEPKPDPKPVTIDVATLLELLVIKKYTAIELVIYLKGYEKGIEQ